VSLSLAESAAIEKISKLLYSFLPWKPHPYANPYISYKAIALELGLKDFYYAEGSKHQGIKFLLENTYEKKRDLFCKLITEIVRRGITYRNTKNDPVKREEILELNNLILQLQFKIPELWDKKFIDSLPTNSPVHVKPSLISDETKEKKDLQILENLSRRLIDISKLTPQERGYEFEKFLNDMFDFYNLNPKSPFRVTGEQIDGSFEFDGDIYLVEAKWQSKQIGFEDLAAFQKKVEGKATWNRGVFVSFNGFSQDGIKAFERAGPTSIICIDGRDLYCVLEGKVTLPQLIKLKIRRAGETGEVYVSAYELIL